MHSFDAKFWQKANLLIAAIEFTAVKIDVDDVAESQTNIYPRNRFRIVSPIEVEFKALANVGPESFPATLIDNQRMESYALRRLQRPTVSISGSNAVTSLSEAN